MTPVDPPPSTPQTGSPPFVIVCTCSDNLKTHTRVITLSDTGQTCNYLVQGRVSLDIKNISAWLVCVHIDCEYILELSELNSWEPGCVGAPYTVPW